jgi:hypothetical protein
MKVTGDYPPEMIATVPSSCGTSPSSILSDVIDFHSVIPVTILLQIKITYLFITNCLFFVVLYIDLAAVTPIVDISPARWPIGLGVLPFLELHTNPLALNTNISDRKSIQTAS